MAGESSHLFLKDPESFAASDPELLNLQKLPYLFTSPILERMPYAKPGLYTLTGGGLTGKTTLLKQWLLKLLVKGVKSQNIHYLDAKTMPDYHALQKMLVTTTNASSPLSRENNLQYVCIDDISAIHEWYKALQHVDLSALLSNTILLCTDANMNLGKKISTYFPSRASSAASDENPIDFYLYPLTFRECILLKYKNHADITIPLLFTEYQNYLIHGGNLRALNELATTHSISESTLKQYSEWLKQEFIKYNRKDYFLLEVLTAIIKHYNEPLTWNLLAQEVSINHPKTIADYMALLESLDVIFIQHALLEKTLTAAPKKARKLMFTNPFIFHALKAWIYPDKNPFENEIKKTLAQIDLVSKLVAATVTTHYCRYFPTYYIKAEGEIDLAYIYDHNFWPIVVTWSDQLRAKDLKQILKYPNGKILMKAERSGMIENIRTEPLPQSLWRLEGRKSW